MKQVKVIINYYYLFYREVFIEKNKWKGKRYEGDKDKIYEEEKAQIVNGQAMMLLL